MVSVRFGFSCSGSGQTRLTRSTPESTRVNSRSAGQQTVNDFGLDFGSDSRMDLAGQVLRFRSTERFGSTRSTQRVNSAG
ncbi:hypothetical protein Hdeb2414_s0078g00778321 [Helianthus debilis subsp. tardiflorus]